MRVVVISDHPLMRRGLSAVAESTGAAVALEAQASDPLPPSASPPHCDLAILDVDTTPIGLSLEICRRVTQARAPLPLVAVQSFRPNLQEPQAFLDAGALACTCLSSSVLGRAQAHVLGGELGGVASTSYRGVDPGNRDAEILRGVANGLRDAEIGSELGYCTDHVKHRIEAIMRHNDLRGRAQLGMWMREQGYVRSPRGTIWTASIAP